MNTDSPAFAASDVAILSRVIDRSTDVFSAEVAREVLAWDFSREDRERMERLSARARQGDLTLAEQFEVDSYDRVGQVLAILQSKARISLRKSAQGG